MADLAGANGQRTEFKVVGRRNLPGKLSYNLATGKARFGMDATAPDMLFAKFLRSPYANAVVESVDTTKAKALPGVVEVLKWDDPAMKSLVVDGGLFSSGPSPFLDNIADQEDAEVAVIVVAESEDVCDEALKLLDVKWDVKPHVVDPRDGARPDAPVVRTPPGGKGNTATTEKIDGDVEAGFKQADQIIEFDFMLPAYASHIPNPSGSMAYWYDDQWASEGQDLMIEGAAQGGDQLAILYKTPLDKVHQVTLYQGGKYCDWGLRKSQLVTPLLAKLTGRPVRCVNKRENMYDFDINQIYFHIKVGFKNDGLITAVRLDSVADNGTRTSSPFGTTSDMGYGPWYTTRCENIHQSMVTVSTNRGQMYTSSQHCPFGWDTMTVAEQLVAEKLGMDVIDVATRNLHGPESQQDPAPVPSYLACIEAGKKLMQWRPHKAGEGKLPDGRLHGAAFRYQMCPRHSFSDYTATVYLHAGKIFMPTQGACTGMFATDAMAMVVAEELGAKWEDVVIQHDMKAPFQPVGGGSDGTTAAAWVIKEAAAKLKGLILEEAAPRLKAKVEDLDTKDSAVYLKSDPSKTVPFDQLRAPSTGNIQSYLSATANGRPPTALWAVGMGKMLDTMNVQFVEVAVDAETGAVEVLRHVVAADTGKVLRPTSLEGQIQQTMMFSSGCQLSEELLWDKASGVHLNNNMFEYKKPTILDIGPTDIDLLETRAGNAAYGGNGISHSLANTHILICAIQNAIGAWVDPPATPDRVLKALGKA
ncbi:MAG: molybdopterin-dependent oxidoreductase [Acidobacteriota bacterium]|jgi:CO/xanthine dehydrogenase Mo-binding subunit|nr:molybdopterin-dependent oxidoreductase [Acidobacteriota bacterium]